ncbi:MAG: putative rane protein [Hydrocarboniphaga sp.]|uniref:hypothetical protein n=1 Tax=Hydrocarboniphaga sp. TaxID=2033016 RepID=UPI00261F131A|nr:hypothetical protein [Hydrocarboniphaga sp.]MDB5967646.1 putative rane protein [Hydrocarboniphaga sp.]
MKKSMMRLLGVAALLLLSRSVSADMFVSVNIAPPALPVYEQPDCPGDGYLWMPGYWAYSDNDPYGGYYWVPGTWVMAPRPGYLWTPPYWVWRENVYVFHPGYWGPHVGFYGGVNYGYGYVGSGYHGGRWEGDRFAYNRAVNNVDVTRVHNTYNTTIINNTVINRVSYNGGNGGIRAQPSEQERVAEREQHVNATGEQLRHEQMAHGNPAQHNANNHGHPELAATPKAAVFHAPEHDRGAPQNRPQQPRPQQEQHQQSHPQQEQHQQSHPQQEQHQQSHPQQEEHP